MGVAPLAGCCCRGCAPAPRVLKGSDFADFEKSLPSRTLEGAEGWRLEAGGWTHYTTGGCKRREFHPAGDRAMCCNPFALRASSLQPIAGLNRVGGEVALPVLPHHRTYCSVYGGSR